MKSKPPIKRVCVTDKKVFYIWPYEVATKRKYCSKKCVKHPFLSEREKLIKYPLSLRKKMSVNHLGILNPRFGKSPSVSTRKKIALAFKEEKSCWWKGEKAGYRAKHYWIVKYYGQPTICEKCKKVKLTGHRIHWANISGRYKRHRKDWKRLCAKCHCKFDKK